MSSSRTALSDSEYRRAVSEVVRHLSQNSSIRSTSLRELTGLNYDQAVKFFNRAIDEGVLVRRGKASGTHYVAASGERPDQ